MQPISAESMAKAAVWPASPIKGITFWAIAALFIIIHFFLQLSFGVMIDGVRESFALDAFQLSILSSAYFVIYVCLQIPAGMLVDRFGPRILLSLGGLVCFLGCLIFSHTTWIVGAIVSRLLMGMGMAFAFISSIHIAGKWFPIRYIAFMVGVTEGVALIGAILSNLILAKAITILKWQQCYFAVAIFIVVFSVFSWIVLRDSPYDGVHKQVKKLNFSKMLNNLTLLLRSGSLWLAGIYAGLCYSLATVYAALWGIPFLIKAHAMNNYSATFASTFIFLGMAVGTPMVTWFFGHGHNKYRQGAMVLCPLILLIAISGVIYWPGLAKDTIFMLHFIIGLASSTLILCYTIVSEMAPPRARSTGIGFVNTLALITAPVFQLIIGFVLEQRALTPEIITSVEAYSVRDYQLALSIIPGSLLLAMIMPFFIRPKEIAEV